jgi:hypothetical protein
MRRLAGETGADWVKTVYGLNHNRHVVNDRAGFSANKKGAGEGAFCLSRFLPLAMQSAATKAPG